MEHFFMSVQAIQYLGSIGLLGEYSPKARKKSCHSADKFDCMCLGSYLAYPEFHGCSWAQPLLIAEDQFSFLYHKATEEDTAAFTLISGHC